MSIMLCPDAEELKRFSLGQLPEPASDQLATHLSNCASCQSELETVVDDSLVADLRAGDPQSNWEDEPACESGMLRSLGALSQLPADNSDGDIPKRIGEYEIIRLLGRGGMGTVYLAHHTRLGRDVALKVLADHRLADSRARQRFESEMQAIGRLSHPGIVAAFDARDIENAAVIVTEFIDGVDLEELVRRVGPLSIADATEIARRVAETLQYTCDAGYVHRDVKPSNIMLSISGEVKLLDLGLARPEIGPGQMTGTGQAMGTADYIAPEQVTDGKNVDIRADIYSLGCTLFKLLTGEVLFGGEGHTTAFAKMTAHVSNQPPKLSSLRSDAPSALEKLLARMLAKSPTDRPASPNDVANSLTPLSKKSNLDALIETAQHADANTSESPQPSTATTLAQPKPFFSQSVPIWTLFCTGLAALTIGIVLGVIITIKYPDGTKIILNAPDGSEVSIAEGKPESPETAASPIRSTPLRKNEEPATQLAQSPLTLAAIVDFSDIPEHEQGAVLRALHNGFDPSEPASLKETPIANYIPLASNLRSVLFSFVQSLDTRFVLVSSKRGSQVAWADLAGHLAATMNERQIKLTFDLEAGVQLRAFLKENVNRDIAVISYGRVVAIEHVGSSSLTQLAIDKNLFEGNELQRLMGHIGGTAQLPDILAKAGLAACVIAKEEDVAAGRGPAFQAFLKSKQELFPNGQKDPRPYSTTVGVYVPLLVPNDKVNQSVANAFGQRWAVIESNPESIFASDLSEYVSVQVNDGALTLSVDSQVLPSFEQFAKRHFGRQLALVSKGRLVSTIDLTSHRAVQNLTIDTSCLFSVEATDLLDRLGSTVQSAMLQGVWLLDNGANADSEGGPPLALTLASFVGNTFAMSTPKSVVEHGIFSYEVAKQGVVMLHELKTNKTHEAGVKFIDASTLELTTNNRGVRSVLKLRRVDMSVDHLANQSFPNPISDSEQVEAMAIRAADQARKLLMDGEQDKSTQ